MGESRPVMLAIAGSKIAAPTSFFLAIFCQFLINEGSQGSHRFENTPKMAFLRHPAAAMRPPFLISALKVIYGHDSGNQRKPAEHAQKLTYLKVSYGN